MVVLLTGSSGFIGRHLAQALFMAGHEVVCAVRNPVAAADQRFRYIAADFSRDLEAAIWLPRLAGIDVVINAVGIIREQGTQSFEALHRQAPCALFSACLAAGVRRVIQVSALGADEAAASRYHLSKKAADDYLASLPLPSAIVQPSLVYGPDGASARLFATLASLPLIPLPGQGSQAIQPVHIDDVTAAIVTLAGLPLTGSARMPLVGPAPLTLRQFLEKLRWQMRLGQAHFLPVPMQLVKLAARFGSLMPASLLDSDTLYMLERGNTASASALAALLQRAPMPVEQFIGVADISQVRLQARLHWLLPLLRWSIAAVWIVTGIVSLGLYPVADSYALLARVGISGWLAPVMLFGAAIMDLALGMAILLMKRRRWLWCAQLAIILFYTAIISWRLPEFWRHPYGPLLKNLPMLAAIWLLLELEER